MKKAEYPQRSCRLHVPGALQDYLCEVTDLHPGPCASLSVPESVRRRDEWEAAHPGWEKMSDFADPFGQVKP